MSTVEKAKVIESLKSKVSGKIVFPGDDDYAAAIFRYSDLSVKNAGAVVYCLNEQDVSEALKFASANGIDIAVKGGGHGFRGCSTEGGMVIDLEKMRQVKVDVENKTVSAQGGCLWEDVDNAAWEKGLACVGGTVNHTGVGGLTLGGGYGYLTPAHGLVIDNLLAATVVLADGRIVKTSLNEEPELFWAIRGGGGNFGVVTEFVYRAHEQKHNIFSGLAIFTPDKAEQVLALAQKYSDESDGKSVMQVGFTMPPPLFQPMILALPFYNGDEAAGREHYKELFALGPVVDATKECPYPVLNTQLNDFAIPGGRKLNRGANFQSVEPAFFHSLKDEYLAFMGENPPPNFALLILFEFYPHKNIDRFKNKDMAFCNRGKRYSIAMIASWADAKDDGVMIDFTRKLIEMAQEEEKRKNGGEALSGSLFYSNYGFGDEKDHTRVYGENYGRLQALKSKYDPKSLFNKWYKIAPVVEN